MSLPLERYPADPLARAPYGALSNQWGAITLPPEEGAAGLSGISEYWFVILRHKWLILACGILGGGLGIAATSLSTPIYRARTLLELRAPTEAFMILRDSDPGAAYASDATYMQTQVRILQTDSLRQRAAAALRARAVGQGADTDPQYSSALRMARRSTYVRPLGTARLIEIGTDSVNPKVAADFANGLVNEFIEQSLELRGDTDQRTQEWLSTQVEELKSNLERSEAQLQAYARESGLLTNEDRGTVNDTKLASLQSELSSAQADRIRQRSQYETAIASSADSLPQELDDGQVRDSVAKLADLRRQLAELTATLMPEHYRVQRVMAQIREVDSGLEKGRARIIARLSNAYNAALRREEHLKQAFAEHFREVSAQSAKAVSYNILKRDVDTNRQLYERVLHKVRETRITSAMRASNVRIVEPAGVPPAPYSPNPMRNITVGASLGLLIGLAGAVVRGRTDRSLREPGDVSSALHVPELGVIPSETLDTEGVDKLLRPALRLLPFWRGENGHRSAGTRECVELITWQRKPSMLAESFRATLASILFSAATGHSPRVLVISSPGPREGKTTMVCNLGLALAEIDRRVLLIDGDMRNPSLHKVFNVANSWGLSDILRERNSLADLPLEGLVRDTEIPGLSLLPAGPATVSISNLLHSNRMPELLQRMRREFDFVLIDTAPLLHVSDGRLIAKLADAAVLVFRAGQTSRDSAMAAIQRVLADGSPLFGTILNDWIPTARRGVYHAYPGSYYGSKAG